jgi:predicted anti-sigma-YlaC factor YlaD
VARIACIVCGIAALGLAFLTFSNVALAGFPDGHVTDYDAAADNPLRVASYVETGFGLLLMVLAFWPTKARNRAVGLFVGRVALVVVAVVAQVGLPLYFGRHLGLDNGIGG